MSIKRLRSTKLISQLEVRKKPSPKVETCQSHNFLSYLIVVVEKIRVNYRLMMSYPLLLISLGPVSSKQWADEESFSRFFDVNKLFSATFLDLFTNFTANFLLFTNPHRLNNRSLTYFHAFPQFSFILTQQNESLSTKKILSRKFMARV